MIRNLKINILGDKYCAFLDTNVILYNKYFDKSCADEFS